MKQFWLALLLGILFCANSNAQTYPNRPVTFIVPWPPGGSTDLAMRSLSVLAEKHLGQRIVIENKPGVSGTMGAQALAQGAKADGYTFAQMPITVFRLPHMTKLAFDPMTDFTYIIHLTGYTFGVVVRADSPHKTWGDLVAWAKANPGKLTYATPGNGTSLHIGMEVIAARDGVKWEQVPFKGYAEGALALLLEGLLRQRRVIGAVQVVGLLVELLQRLLELRLLERLLERIVQRLHRDRVHALGAGDAEGRVHDHRVAQVLQRRHVRPALGALPAPGDQQPQLARVHVLGPARGIGVRHDVAA